MKRPLITSSASQFVGAVMYDIPEPGRAFRRFSEAILLGDITHEDAEDTLILAETPRVGGGPLASDRYIR